MFFATQPTVHAGVRLHNYLCKSSREQKGRICSSRRKKHLKRITEMTTLLHILETVENYVLLVTGYSFQSQTLPVCLREVCFCPTCARSAMETHRCCRVSLSGSGANRIPWSRVGSEGQLKRKQLWCGSLHRDSLKYFRSLSAVKTQCSFCQEAVGAICCVGSPELGS